MCLRERVCVHVLFTCSPSKTGSVQSEVNSNEEVIAHKGDKCVYMCVYIKDGVHMRDSPSVCLSVCSSVLSVCRELYVSYHCRVGTGVKKNVCN